MLEFKKIVKKSSNKNLIKEEQAHDAQKLQSKERLKNA